MRHGLFCFTGTGNSLHIAKQLGKKLNCPVRPMHVDPFEDLAPELDTLGIVFPVYHQGLPNMVRTFVQKLNATQAKYIYAVATYGDHLTLALQYLNDALQKQGLQLHAGFGVKMPYNYVRPTQFGRGFYNSFQLQTPRLHEQEAIFNTADKTVRDLTKAVKNQETRPIPRDHVLIETLVDRLNLRNTVQKKQWLKACKYRGTVPKTFPEAIHLMDAAFTLNDRCNQCAVCGELCPVDNIHYPEGLPHWKGKCEQCLACIHWCPQKAIQFGDRYLPVQLYHHPDIQLSELQAYNNGQAIQP